MASQPKIKKKIGGELGDSGVQIFNGIITGEEYIYDLMGWRGLKMYDEMRKSDGSVKAALSAIKLPVKAVPWFVEPASDSPQDKEIAEFAEHVIFDVLRWKTILGEILTHLEFGFSVHEKVFDVQVVDGTERIVLKKLAFRKQTSIDKWTTKEGEKGVTQTLSRGGSVSIPIEDLVIFTNEQEGDNYEGISILRAAYKHYYFKNNFYKVDAIANEKHGLGVVEVVYPANATQGDKTAAETAAQEVRANERSFLSHSEQWTTGFMDMKANTLKSTEPSVNHHDRQISKSVLAPFLDLGATSGSGSRAVGDVQLELFEKAVQAVIEQVADTFNQYVMKDLIDMNFNVTDYPKLTTGQVSKDNIPEISEAVDKFVTAGAITLTDEDEEHVRDLIRFPKMNDDIKGLRGQGEDEADLPTPPAVEEDDPNKVVAAARWLKKRLGSLAYGDKNRAA
ncbi:DUF935 family protein [Streptomyces sp. NPDC056401]|uniref:phage portal protein family protein n=1 Tax=Streptomyces sp. NPDC056401 TaxID=3345809 RepID=UPI0035DE247C